MIVTIQFTDDQLDAIAERVAAKIGKPATRNPLTISEFARQSGKSWPTIKKWVDAGIITKLPIPGDTLIAHSELERFRAGSTKQHA